MLLTILAALATQSTVSYAVSLPDGRGYELVSPAQKGGGIGGVFPLGSLTHFLEQFGRPMQSATDGSAIAYEGEDFYQPRVGSLTQYISLNGSEGWLTQSATPGVPSTTEPSGFEINRYVGFSPDLAVGVISTKVSLAKEAPDGFANLYLVQGSSLQPMLTTTPPNRTATTFGYAKLSRHVIVPSLFFAGGNAGTAASPAFSHMPFAANDALDGTGAVAGDGFKNNLYEWAGGSIRLVNVLPHGETEPGASFGVNFGDEYNNMAMPSLSHVISADGSRIFWTDENNGALYVREDGEKTTLIANGGAFQTASTDGSRVFYTKGGHLYEYDTDSGATADLASGGSVEGMVGASDDGTYVYFVAETKLYLSHELPSHERTLTFIATLSPNDNQTPEIYGGGSTPEGDWYQTFAGRTAAVSPNGRYVVFMSRKNLTGYNNADATEPRLDYEVFLYDSATAELACASCNTDGSRPTGNTLLPAPVNGFYQQRYLDDAGRLFFDTVDAVLPQDTNGASDVYEYENGQVYLISPGIADDEAVFADASESGNDVFFTTRQQLVPADQDSIVDLYDARVGARQEASPLAPCVAEACRELPNSSPSFAPPASTVFGGPGNVVLQPPTPVKPAPLTRAQKLARALKACRSVQNGHKRARCQARARKRY